MPEPREIDEATLERALAAARAAREHAHAPHSGFRVGAAVVTSGGSGGGIHTGCNVESASYGLTLCAERAALASWIDAGGLARGESVDAVVISTRSGSPTAPCGACRQWIAELAPRALVVAEAELVSGGAHAEAADAEATDAEAADAEAADAGTEPLAGGAGIGGGGGGGALPGRPGSVLARWRIGDLLPDAFTRDDLPR